MARKPAGKDKPKGKPTGKPKNPREAFRAHTEKAKATRLSGVSPPARNEEW